MGRLKTHIKDHESIVNEIFIETEIESMAPSEYNFKIENDVIWIY